MGNREHCLNLYIFFRIKHSYNTKKIYIIAIKNAFLVFKLIIARNNGVKFYLIFFISQNYSINITYIAFNFKYKFTMVSTAWKYEF